MAGVLIGESILSGVLEVLIARMVSSEVLDFFKGQKLDYGLLKKLNTTMISVTGLLDDAEEKQITKPAVKKWLDELKDAAYEADDILDEIAYEGQRLEVETSGIDQVRDFFSSLNPFNKKVMGEIEAKLEEILERLEYLIKQKDALGLREGVGGEKPSLQRVSTTSLVDESGVYGRDDDKETLLKLLLSDDANGNNLGVIPIVGMGGIGKTTLAQLIYNDIRVQEWFDLKGWVCVSEDFDVFKVTNDILKEVDSVASDTRTPNQLQLKLRDSLMGKKFLLVLDDIWNDKYDDWDFLVRPLKSGAQGSKIIVTTRNDTVASIVCTVPAHHLKELTDDNCWLLFAKHAYGHENSGANLELEVIGREIVRKCKGLPLAAKTLGGLLRSTRDVKEWEKILKSNVWDLPNDTILPALRLSYHYLPSHLKRCFAYCAMFPKDYEFEQEELVLLWMAEGFLVQSEGNKEVGELGGKYFQDLVSKSFFQQSSGRQSFFVMHDLINDLAKFVSGEFCFRLDSDDSSEIDKRTRHLSYEIIDDDSAKKFDCIYKAQYLRTFLSMKSPWGWNYSIDNEVMHNFLSAFKQLRVLSLFKHCNVTELSDSIGCLKHLRYLNLSATSIERLPDNVSNLYNLQIVILCKCRDLAMLPNSIGNLKHLQYLDLSKTSIIRLPESVTSLYNLQTLILYECNNITELPTDMGRLINLCCLNIMGTKLQVMPPQIGELAKLRKLTDFYLGRQCGSSIKELGELQLLQGDLCIWNLQNIVDAQEALEANLKGKKHLRSLGLIWDGDTDDSIHERRVLEQLQPHINMKILVICGYGGTRFPYWVGDSSFSNIMSLKLTACKYCSSLPALGQLPSLKHLIIEDFDGVMTVGPEFYGSCISMIKPFRSLETLRFERMPLWNEWLPWVDEDKDKDGAFPLLQELDISECPNLRKELPGHLPSLKTLKIKGCDQLVASLPRSPTICKVKLEDFSRDVLLVKLHSGLCNLEVEKFHSQDCLIEGMVHMGCFLTLVTIRITSCSSLKCFPLDLFPSLKNLSFLGCPNLESLFVFNRPLQEFPSLFQLTVQKCPNLVSFGEEGLLVPNLTSLHLWHCSKLKSLPNCMHSLFPSLVKLFITKCPELESFPEGGLPSKLQSLFVEGCNKLIAGRMQWNLHRLPSLSIFTIGESQDVESFPDHMILPSTLASLQIRHLQNLKSLDHDGFRPLTSLRELTIGNCHELHSMPEEGLPSSLSSLSIWMCPLLEQRCEQEKGVDWPKICHIPDIEINFKKIN